MKYENPTCEIVLLDSADCLESSIQSINDFDTPFVDFTPNY